LQKEKLLCTPIIASIKTQELGSSPPGANQGGYHDDILHLSGQMNKVVFVEVVKASTHALLKEFFAAVLKLFRQKYFNPQNGIFFMSHHRSIVCLDFGTSRSLANCRKCFCRLTRSTLEDKIVDGSAGQCSEVQLHPLPLACHLRYNRLAVVQQAPLYLKDGKFGSF
jgi:hypothetical protein